MNGKHPPPTIHVLCPYCEQEADYVMGDEIYPHRPDLFEKGFYLCRPCKAYVGSHAKTTYPLGRLANKELRQAKMAAHRAFDPLWRNGELTRAHAYSWLAKEMNLKKIDCHIGMFDINQCNQVVSIIDKRRK